MKKILLSVSVILMMLTSFVASAAFYPAGVDNFIANDGVASVRTIQGDVHLQATSTAAFHSVGGSYTVTITPALTFIYGGTAISDSAGVDVPYVGTISGASNILTVVLPAGDYTIKQVGLLRGKTKPVNANLAKGSYTFLIQ